MRITAASITDFKRVRSVEIRPPADRTLILIGGNNMQGKSSVLDALTAAFGGKKALPAEAIRRGAGQATITVELDGGALTIHRVIERDGGGFLEVRDEIGARRSPQTVLDQLVGARFLDPLAFLALPAKEQRAVLMGMIKEASRIAQLDAERERAFDRRTEVSRDLTKTKAELARLPDGVERVASPIDVAALNAQAREFGDQQRAGDALGVQAANRKREAETAEAALAQNQLAQGNARALLAKLEAEERELETVAKSKRDAAGDAAAKVDEAVKAWAASLDAREQLDRDLARAGKFNREVFEYEATNKRRAEAEAAIDKLEAEHAALSAVLRKVDDRKAELLEAAKLPVEGLGVVDDGIVLGGVPFAQASRAEQFRVAMALAMAAAPKLEDVWVRDGAVLDDAHLQQLAELAAAAGKRVWIERVGDRDPGAIIIQDGGVKS